MEKQKVWVVCIFRVGNDDDAVDRVLDVERIVAIYSTEEKARAFERVIEQTLEANDESGFWHTHVRKFPVD